MSAVLRKYELNPQEVELTPMRRRHLRQVLKIEDQVYPRPWSSTLFLQEMVRRSDRYYIVARHAAQVVGYAGLMITGPEAHITTIAVDPALHRQRIGMKMMMALVDEAIGRGCKSVSLEVRKSNTGAQKLYEKFGFKAVGVRRGYYIETGEDAIVMWADDVDNSDYQTRLAGMRPLVETPPAE
jgi:ribosomal-protein-alanine N-acetyltransferase